MGLFSHIKNSGAVRPEQKWDYIQLNDFKSANAFTYIAYGYVFVSLTISTAVYAVDTFTAVNLLVFNKWSSEIQPTISFDVAKWIFSICIILSFVNIAYEHVRAQIIIRRGSVAESYLDNLCVRLQSTRIFGGKGWRRFLVFAELTKSKKGAEYIALFTYFSFQSWIRVIFCSGPRQVVNASTLYSVYNAKLAVDGDNLESSLESIWEKIKALAEQDYQQALILSGMLFTLVIWVFSALSLLMAVLFFVFFLWGWIPKNDGGLSGYCERKINKRLMNIVSKKVDAALADQEQKRKKAELKAAKKAGELPPEERKATLPTFLDDKLPDMPTITRQDTVSTLPLYTSRPGTPPQGEFEMNAMRPMPTRSETQTTASSRAPLLQSGADMGQASPAIPSPYAPSRTGTMTSTSTRPPMGPPQLTRVQTNNSSFGASYSETPSTYSPDNNYPSVPQPVRSPTASIRSYGFPPTSTPGPRRPYDEYNRSASPAPSRPMPPRGPFDDYSSNGRASPAPSRPMPSRGTFDDYSSNGRASPAPSARSVQTRGPFDDFPTGRASPAPSMHRAPAYGQGGYQSYNSQGSYPVRSQTGPMPQRGPPMPQPQRNMTAPMPQRMHPMQFQEDYIERPGTSHSQRSMPGGALPQQQRPPMPGYGNGYSDHQSQRGGPGSQYGDY